VGYATTDRVMNNSKTENINFISLLLHQDSYMITWSVVVLLDYVSIEYNFWTIQFKLRAMRLNSCIKDRCLSSI